MEAVLDSISELLNNCTCLHYPFNLVGLSKKLFTGLNVRTWF